MSEQTETTKDDNFNIWEVLTTSILILALLGVVALLYWEGLRFTAEIYNSRAVRALNQQKIDQAQSLEQKAVNLASFEDRYHRFLSRIYLFQIGKVVNNKELSGEQRQRQLQNLVGGAVAQARRATQLADRNVANWVNQAFLHQNLLNYAVQGADKQAINSYEKAMELDPVNSRLPAQLAQVYIAQANIAARGKNKAKVQSSLKEAKKYLQKALELNSNFANARYFLGLVYDRLGQKQKAIEQFEKIASLSDQNKKQVQGILKNLKAGRSALRNRKQLPTKSEEVPDLEGATSTSATSTGEKEN